MQYSVNITFICTGKPKICVTHFIVIFALLWWFGTEPAISPKYSCIILSCCVTNYCKLVTLKQDTFITSQFLWVRVKQGLARFSAQGLTRLQSKGQLGLHSHESQDPLPRSFRFWQNSIPCSCRTEVPVFLLAIGWDCSQFLEAIWS